MRPGAHRLQRTGPRRRRRRPKPGSQPGSLALPPDAPPLEIHAICYDREQVEEHTLESVDDLVPLLQSERCVWIDIRGLGDEERLERIREVLGLHPLAMADIVNVPQRPKVERYEDRSLIIVQMARVGPEIGVELDQVSLVLGPGWVASFTERSAEVFEPVRERIRAGSTLIRKMGADFLFYALLDAVVDGFYPVAESIDERLDDLEEEIVERPDRSSLERIHSARRVLIQLNRIQWRQRDAVRELLRDEDLPISPSVRFYLRDVHDHTIQVLDLIETQRDIAVGLMDIYLSAISNRMNEIMKTLTIMASIFIPLTFIEGVYGMNFEYMPELHWRYGYPAVWAVMITTAAGLLVWFHHRGWLERARPSGLEKKPERTRG